MTATTSPLLDWLDVTEAQLADSFARSLEDDATLRNLAQAWRGNFAALVAQPSGSRLDAPTPQSLTRGPGPGGLGDGYPTALFAQLKAGWSAAVSGLALAESCTPSGWQRASEAAGLAASLASATPPAIAPTPAQIVHTSSDVRLRRYDVPGASGDPILVVAPMINRWYVLDLLEGRSFAGMLASLGRPLYLLEWRAPQGGPDERGFGELCAGPLSDAVERVVTAERCSRVGLVGYCQGGTLAMIYAARFPGRVARLATVGAPARFADGGLFRRWFDRAHLDVDLVAGTGDRVSAWLVHLPFWWLRPTVKTRKLTGLVRGFQTHGALDPFLAAEIWNQDHMDMTRGVFKSWCGDLYQDDALINGQVSVAGEAVSLDAIRCPVLVVSGAYDAITPTSAAEALLEHCSPRWAETLCVKNGHVGMLTSPRALTPQRDAFAAWQEATA